MIIEFNDKYKYLIRSEPINLDVLMGVYHKVASLVHDKIYESIYENLRNYLHLDRIRRLNNDNRI